jgi:uncharacterized surface protein with fasciclin (FAS1) repeats
LSSLVYTLVIFLLLSAATCTASAQDTSKQTIVTIAKENGDFKTLVTALDAANLTDTLNGEGTFTVFAPTDEAFAALPKGTLDALLKDPIKLKKILLYHVVSGNLTAKDVVKMKEIKTLEGQNVPVKVTGQEVFLGNAKITKTDINARNGVIHVINAVLIPPATPS